MTIDAKQILQEPETGRFRPQHIPTGGRTQWRRKGQRMIERRWRDEERARARERALTLGTVKE